MMTFFECTKEQKQKIVKVVMKNLFINFTITPRKHKNLTHSGKSLKSCLDFLDFDSFHEFSKNSSRN